MELNADFAQPATVVPSPDAWRPSPLPGVDRLMLDRIGDEVARATSLVRYAAGSRFSEHKHDMGEEFLVLEGTFSDASGDFGPGTYVRNPPGSAHAPWSDGGCTIFVKLRQFDPADTARVVVNLTIADWNEGDLPGVSTLPLHRYDSETVDALRLAPGASLDLTDPAGLEIMVFDGTLTRDGETLPAWSWVRLPAGGTARVTSPDGATLFRKTGHLGAAG